MKQYINKLWCNNPCDKIDTHHCFMCEELEGEMIEVKVEPKGVMKINE